MYIIILGAPGAGKGTQAENIARHMKLEHISTGDLFRQAIDKGNKLGDRVKECMKKGMLVPDEVTTKMILKRLALDDNKNGALLDGFPRNIKQARALDKALKKKDKVIHKALYIRVSKEELVRRLSGRRVCRQCQTPHQVLDEIMGQKEKCKHCGGELYQRADDNLEAIKQRLKIYFSETLPVIEYYKKQGKLVEVDGEGNIELITARILDRLRKREFITR